MGRTLCPVVVGRDRELEALDAACRDLDAGRGACLVLTGEAGIGKSRLARELAARAQRDDMRVALGRAVPAGGSEPYRPLTEALLQLCLDRSLADDPALEPWRAALAPVLPNLAAAATTIATGAAPDPAGPPLSASVRAEAVLQAVRSLAPRGAVVTLEDLHWADPDTLAIAEYMAEHVTRQATILVLTSRDEPGTPVMQLVRRLWGRTGVVHLPLERLTPAQTAEMVAACLAGADTESGAAARVGRSAEGIPLLVEELLASPGLPESIADTVVARLADMAPEHRRVLQSAATLGRRFDWELLPATTGLDDEAVAAALAAGVERQLLLVEEGSFRFRHALTRDAVLSGMLPPQHRAVAAAALAALDAAHPDLPGALEDAAADLAVQAGQRSRAATVLHSTGRRALRRGAIDTAIDTLYRAAELCGGQAERSSVELTLVEALALAGRVDEASAVAQRLIGDEGEGADLRVEAHLLLAQAAVSAARWTAAGRHLQAASELTGDTTPAGTGARMALLFSEVEVAAGNLERAHERAEEALALAGPGSPEVSCHAFEILGRSCRLRDPARAREFFERGLARADGAALPHWRLRALQEVGTIDMFDRLGVERLLEAGRLADQAGAVTTAASLDLQLAACFTARWELDSCDEHARSALARAERFRLDVVKAKALALLSGSASMRADAEATDRLARLARAAAPEDRWLEGFSLLNRGMARLMAGDIDQAMGPFAEGMAVINRVPHGDPAAARVVWPLLLAHLGDRRAAVAIEESHRLGIAAFHLNRGILAYAEAVVAGAAGEPQRAARIAAEADVTFVNAETWLHLCRFLASERAARDGWGDQAGWAAAAADAFASVGLPGLAARAGAVSAGASPNPWAGAGITEREAQVLRLVAAGRANKEIATELGLSVRTVEKHVESLLRKTGARSRTELAVGAAGT